MYVYSKPTVYILNFTYVVFVSRINVTFMLPVVKSCSHLGVCGFLHVLEALEQPESIDV